MTGAIAVLVALVGLVVGSFLNVCIVRIPAAESLWRPRSRCPDCRTPIAAGDNVPLVSYARLRGRCRACGRRIPLRYPLVEAGTSALFLASYWRFGLGEDLAVALVLGSALIVLTAIDLEHQILPDVITLPGIAAGLAASVVTGRVSWLESAVGILVGGGTFFVIISLSRGGMGGGDMKLGAALGAFLGWKVMLVALLIAVLAGGAVAIVLLASGARGRKDPVPFGPFLAAGGLAGFFWGERLLAWYLDTFR
jgi:leader peptidase (prepilin peptidase)/N-methyltransferase